MSWTYRKWSWRYLGVSYHFKKTKMTKTEIEEYLLKLEHKLLFESDKIQVQLTRDWTKQFPLEAGVYIFREDGEICYVGETGSLKGRMTDILNTQNHTIRRNIGEVNFSNVPNYQKASSKKKFPENIEKLVDEWMETKMTLTTLTIPLGRKELEERMYEKFTPKYNLKGQRGSNTKTYTKKEKQLKHRQAYEPWTLESD